MDRLAALLRSQFTLLGTLVALFWLEELVDGFLLEVWKEGVIGGAGVKLALDPRVIREPLPSEAHFILAGGLTPENVAEAAVRFQPDVLDVSSGVESLQGCKDPELMRRFIEVARASRQYDSGVTSLSRGGDIR